MTMGGVPNGKETQAKPPTRVCVIGAGVCGIVATKICLESGLRVTCYEKSAKFGGLWNYRPDEPNSSGAFEPSVMRTTVLNTSKELSAFSDFPPPAELPNFMRHNQYMDYIRSYVEHFKLAPAIHLEHEIVACQLEWANKSIEHPRIKWLVWVKNLKTNEVSEQHFDKLMVAVGHHNIPFQPTYTGQQQFKGEIIHSARLKDILSSGDRFQGKNVLIVGFGNSACDAANDIAMVANKCYVSCHRGQWFTSRFLADGPYDFRIKSRIYNYATRMMPTSMTDRIVIDRLEQRVNHEMLGLKPRHKPSEQVPAINDLFPYRVYTGAITLKSSIKTFTEKGVIFESGGDNSEEEQQETPIDMVVLATGYEAKIPFLDEFQLGLRSAEHNNEYDLFLNIFAPSLQLPKRAQHSSELSKLKQQQQATSGKKVKNNNCHNCHGCNDCNNCNNCNFCNSCNSCNGCNGCQSCNGANNCQNCVSCNSCKDCYNCKSCNSCTNCRNQTGLNGQSNVGVTSKTTCEPGSEQLAVIKSLAFIGLVQPNGSITVISELQARYAALVFKGQCELPTMKWMFKHMEQTRKMRSTSIRSHSRDQLIGSYVSYMETLARLMNVRPNLFKLFFTDHKLWKQLLFGPCVPYQYRLTGPGYWNEARQVTLSTFERVNCGINEGKNHILYKARRKCLNEIEESKKAAN